MNKEIKCKDCKHYFRGEVVLSEKFIKIVDVTLEDGTPIIPGISLDVENILGNLVCNHPDCFTWEDYQSPEKGSYIETIRIAGQAQFNPDNKCSRFQKRTWFTEVKVFFNSILPKVKL